MSSVRCLATATVLAALLTTGCSRLSDYQTAERFRHGYTIVLPGIEGRSPLNTGIANGLVRGGVPTAIEVHDWTLGGVLTAPINLRAEWRNRREAERIARKITTYQNQYPGKPVYLIGHSGGGGEAVYVLEALPANRKITVAILLGPALAPEYDLSVALSRTEQGIWNFHSVYDVAWLGAGTTTMGTMDGEHASAAGAVGFVKPWLLGEEESRLYARLLHQQSYTPKMAQAGHAGGHTGWAKSTFVAEWLAPILLVHMHEKPDFASDPKPE